MSKLSPVTVPIGRVAPTDIMADVRWPGMFGRPVLRTETRACITHLHLQGSAGVLAGRDVPVTVLRREA